MTARDGCETVDIICNDTEHIMYFEVFLCVCVCVCMCVFMKVFHLFF